MSLSDADIMGIFSIYDLTGRQLAQVQFSIPGGGLVFSTSSPSDLNLPKTRSAMRSSVITARPTPSLPMLTLSTARRRSLSLLSLKRQPHISRALLNSTVAVTDRY
jgi:hypothetical protein